MHRADARNRAAKEARVREGRAHAALVFDDDGIAQGWCQYGSPEELPAIKHRREYEKDAPPLPDWRITCFYVDKKHRGQGIARAALGGALEQIAAAGGGLVEAISEVTTGREAAGPVPVQRDRRVVRGPRVQPGPAGRQACLDRQQAGRPGLTAISARCGGRWPGRDGIYREPAASSAAERGLSFAMSSSSLAPGATKPISLRWIFQHMIEEYARHNGHVPLASLDFDVPCGPLPDR